MARLSYQARQRLTGSSVAGPEKAKAHKRYPNIGSVGASAVASSAARKRARRKHKRGGKS